MKWLQTAWIGTARSYGQKHAATWEEVEEEIIIQNVPKLTSEVGLKGVNEDSIEDLQQSHGESVTNDELRELAE